MCGSPAVRYCDGQPADRQRSTDSPNMPQADGPAVRIQLAGFKGLVDPRLAQGESCVRFLRSLDGLIRDGQAFKDDTTSSVSRAQWNGRDIVVKRYNHKGLCHSVRHTLKGSRAKRNWVNAHRLGRLSIATPGPLAYVEAYRGPLLWRSYFITQFASGRQVHDVFGDPAVEDAEKRCVNDLVLDLLGVMADHGITHGDMKHTNLLYDGHRIVLMDLDAMRFGGIRSLRRRRHRNDRRRYLRDVT